MMFFPWSGAQLTGDQSGAATAAGRIYVFGGHKNGQEQPKNRGITMEVSSRKFPMANAKCQFDG